MWSKWPRGHGTDERANVAAGPYERWELRHVVFGWASVGKDVEHALTSPHGVVDSGVVVSFAQSLTQASVRRGILVGEASRGRADWGLGDGLLGQ